MTTWASSNVWRVYSDTERRAPLIDKSMRQGPQKSQMLVRCGRWPACNKERWWPTDVFIRASKNARKEITSKFCSKRCGLFGKKRPDMIGKNSSPEKRLKLSIAQKLRYNVAKPFSLSEMKRKYWTDVKTADGSAFTTDDFVKALEKQNGKCGFPGCTTLQSGLNRAFHVDHDHSTQLFRALLCGSCNYHLIGKHTIESANNALNYLIQHSSLGK